MAALSNYMEAQIVEHFLRNNALTSPTNVYLALFTSDPTDDGSGTEASFTNYVRVVSAWTAFASGVTKNVSSIAFPGNGGADVTITHVALFDAITTGNMLIHGALDASKLLGAADVLAFAANGLEFELD